MLHEFDHQMHAWNYMQICFRNISIMVHIYYCIWASSLASKTMWVLLTWLFSIVILACTRCRICTPECSIMNKIFLPMRKMLGTLMFHTGHIRRICPLILWFQCEYCAIKTVILVICISLIHKWFSLTSLNTLFNWM